MIYPWQREQWARLKRMHETHCLPHALLLTGAAGMAKQAFAASFAAMLFCENTRSESKAVYAESTQPCICQACRLVSGRTHPDVLWLEPEQEGQAIKIDQVRAGSEFLTKTGLHGDKRVMVICPAHQLNQHAVHALLKTLEEPPPDSLIMLLTHQFQQLPATILSRCQRIHFPLPSRQVAIDWLKEHNLPQEEAELLLALAHGVPLTASTLRTSPSFLLRLSFFDGLCRLAQLKNNRQEAPLQAALQCAEKIKDADVLVVIDFALSWLQDLLKLHLKIDQSHIINLDYKTHLQALKEKFVMKKIVQFCEKLNRTRQFLQQGINLNKQFVMESILLGWLECRDAAC